MTAEQNKTVPYYFSDTFSERVSIYKIWLTIMVVFIHSYSEGINFGSGSIVLDVPAWLETVKFVVSQSISRCAVPAFFMISAIFLYRKDFCWKTNIQKKLKTLMVPYLLLNSFWIVFYFTCQHIPVLSNYFSNPDNMIAQWTLRDWLEGYGIFAECPILYPLWFVKYLFVLNVLAMPIRKLLEKAPRFFLAVLLLVWLFCASSSVTQAICFWGMGCIFCILPITPEQVPARKGWIAVSYVLLLGVSAAVRSTSVGGFVNHLGILVGILFWYVLFTDFQNPRIKKTLIGLSRYTFPVFIFHEMYLTIFQKLAGKVLPQTPAFQLLQYVAIPVVIIVYCLVLSMVLERFLPKLYGLLTGNRKR